MFKAILKFWPAIIPVLIFIIWWVVQNRKKDIKVIDVYAEKRNNYAFYTLVASFLIILVMAVMFYFDPN